MRPPLPFTAIVGQEQMKLALLLAVVNPAVGGVLLTGEKGTGKTTAVRGLSTLLPQQEVVSGCLFGCDPEAPSGACGTCRGKDSHLATGVRRMPLVELPLNATEERVAGGIDISSAIETGKVSFSPGLLAEANRGILYVDEINLLDPGISRLIIDAASSGWNRVEREGVSVVHPSTFVLIGSMNPEEGELDPQLMDRMGLCVEVKGSRKLEERLAILRLHQRIETPGTNIPLVAKQEKALRTRLSQAINRLPQVEIEENTRRFIAQLSISRNVEGHRADLILEAASRALCALEGGLCVTIDHVLKVAPLVFIHRMRKRPQTQRRKRSKGATPNNKPQDKNTKGKRPEETRGPSGGGRKETATDGYPNPPNNTSEQRGKGPDQKGGQLQERIFQVGQSFMVRPIKPAKDRLKRVKAGRRSPSLMNSRAGRWSGVTVVGTRMDICLASTIRAAAPFQRLRHCQHPSGLAIQIEPQDIRFKKRVGRVSSLVVFVVDASGSMGAKARMVASKGAIMSLLLDCYRKRDKVAMISFRGDEAKIDLSPTSSVELAGKHLTSLPTGGRTPLASGLMKAYQVVKNHLLKDPLTKPLIILITDGRVNRPMTPGIDPVEELDALASNISRDKRMTFLVVDTEDKSGLRLGLCDRLASRLGATCFRIDELRSEHLVSMIKEHS